MQLFIGYLGLLIGNLGLMIDNLGLMIDNLGLMIDNSGLMIRKFWILTKDSSLNATIHWLFRIADCQFRIAD
jgi:hypothetical protein